MSSITPELIKDLRNRTGVGIGKCKEALEATNGNLEDAIAHLRKMGVASAAKKESRETNEGAIAYSVTDEAIAIIEMNAETDFVVNNEKFQTFHKELVQEAENIRPKSLEEFLAAKKGGKTVDEARKEIISVLGENINVARVGIVEKEANASYGVYSHMHGKIVAVVEIAGDSGQEELAYQIAMHVAAEAPEYLKADDVPESVRDLEMDIAKSQIPENRPPEIREKILQGKMKAYFDQVCLLHQKYIRDNSMTVEQVVEAKAKELGKKLELKSFLRWAVGG